MFNPLLPHPEPAAAGAVGLAGSSSVGPWGLLATLYAGESADLWSLRGPLSTGPGRSVTGASTLFLMSFGDTPGLPAGLAVPTRLWAVLRAGDDLRCWQLLDTDVVRPFPAPFKDPDRIQDRSGISAGTLDAQAYTEVLVMANYTSARAFLRAARKDLTFAHLVSNPARYRGEVVRIQGRLRRILRLKDEIPPEARARGVNDLYQAWIFPEGSGQNPFRVDFTELPAGFDRNLLSMEKVDPPLPVRCAGYFFKRFRYTSEGGKERDAPLLIAHSLTVLPVLPAAPPPDSSGALPVVLGLLGLMVAVAVGLACWFRWGDRRVRKRVLATRPGEFVEPVPEATPIAPPLLEPLNGDGRNNGVHGP